jgi:diacylglycerol kinase family enzyme
MKRILTTWTVCLILSIGLATAQVAKVTGWVVSEEDGEPVIGATVLVKGTTQGTITDTDGKFELMLVRAPKDLAQIGECIQALQKQQYNCGMLTFRSTSRLTVHMKEALDWTLDGERQGGKNTIEIENIPQAIILMR